MFKPPDLRSAPADKAPCEDIGLGERTRKYRGLTVYPILLWKFSSHKCGVNQVANNIWTIYMWLLVGLTLSMWIFPWPRRWRCWAMKNQHQLWHRYWGPRGMMDGGRWAWLGKRTYGFSWANTTECRRSCAISCRETLLNKEYKVGLKEAARDTWSRAPGCNVFWDKTEDGCVHIPTAFREREKGPNTNMICNVCI